MTFISYAQNFEDVMLRRALKNVENGFYVDVGAGDPVVDSVTKYFYEKGWRGINIEPVKFWYDKIVLDRPGDINLNIACSSAEGNIRLFEVINTGMSTINPEYASRHAKNSHEVVELLVPARRLDSVIEESRTKEIHFLKIDVEGAEALVLKGIHLGRFRPWIILIESTEPNSSISTHKEWESLVIGENYDFVYFDGLNRFYLAREQGRLREAFSSPPNCLDQYVRYAEWHLKQKTEKQEIELQQLKAGISGRICNFVNIVVNRVIKKVSGH